jgi:hypothetical protein
MEVQIDWLGIVVATVAAMVIGSVWYSKWLLGPMWQKLVGVKDSEMKMNAAPAMTAAVVLTLLTAYVLNHLIYVAHAYYDYSWVQSGLTTAFWVWLGIAFPFQWMSGMFENRRRKLIVLNLSNQLITLLVMGAIIGYFLNN